MKNQQNKANIDSITGKKSFLLRKPKSLVLPVLKKDETKSAPKAKEKEVYTAKPKKFKFIEFKKPKLFSIHGTIIILLLLPIFLFGLVSYVYEVNNQGKIYSGVRVLGTDVGGMSRQDLAKMVNSKIGGYKLTIEGENQKFEANEADLGINFDKQTILNDAYNFGRDDSVLNNFFNRTKRFLSNYPINFNGKTYVLQKHIVATPYKVDENKLNQFLASVESKINLDPKDSQVTTQGASMQIIPAVFGRKLKTAELKDKILHESETFDTTPIKFTAEVTNPTISDEKTRVLAQQADQITSKNVTLTYKGKTFSPTKETIVSWVTFTRSDDKADWKMFIDPSKMYSYFDSVGNTINIWPKDRNVRVENEVKQIVTQEGANGLVIDEDSLGSQISSKLQSDSQINLEIPMKVAPFKTNVDNVVVANWDQYIDVNLSTQHMDAYLKGGVRVGSWAITSGRNGWATPLGQFLILRKAYNVCMPNPPSSQPLCGVHYVSYFTGAGHAIHEAWWRSYFGGQDYVWNGSHGCINAPYSVAQFIYNWAPIGTPVTIHY